MYASDSANSLLVIYPRKASAQVHQDLDKDVHSGFVHKHPKLEAT